jgi:hypothetical protein
VADNSDVSHERSDVSTRGVAVFGLGLLIVALLVHFGVYWLVAYYQRNLGTAAPAPPGAGSEEPAPVPRLQVSPPADLAEMRAAEAKTLESYGWVDRQRKIVRIPIERAMDLLAEKGLPARKSEQK